MIQQKNMTLKKLCALALKDNKNIGYLPQKLVLYVETINCDCINSFKASSMGHLHCLKYAHDHGYLWAGDVCKYAAYNGHLECLKYAHENGCPWDEDVCKYAAYNGHLACLKYAHENGCPWDRKVYIGIGQRNNFNCLKYAYENGCPVDEVYKNAIQFLMKIK